MIAAAILLVLAAQSATTPLPQRLGELDFGTRGAVLESGFTAPAPSIEVRLREKGDGPLVGGSAPRLLVQIRHAGESRLVFSEKMEPSAIVSLGAGQPMALVPAEPFALETGKSYVLRIKVRRPLEGGGSAEIVVTPAAAPAAPEARRKGDACVAPTKTKPSGSIERLCGCADLDISRSSQRRFG